MLDSGRRVGQPPNPMMDAPYQALGARMRQVGLLNSTASVLGWDQETMMPAGGVEHRAKQMAQLARLSHEMAVAPELADLLAACEADAVLLEDPRSEAAVNVRETRREYDRAVRLPPELVAELAETTSLAQHTWAEARAASDFAQFQPWLEKLVGLVRRQAECLGWPANGEAWDALAEDFEPGITACEVEAVFGPLRQRLTALLGDLRDNGTPPGDAFLTRELPIGQQEAFVRHVVAELGFDFGRGRLDRSTHPFSVGVHCGDVRITTRFGPANLLDALGSTMHEAGHGMYEQGLPAEHAGTPRGDSISLGIHESQSRLWENQVGRSRAFWQWCHPLLASFFGDAAKGFGLDEVWRTANRVEAGFIRVEADELTYNLHVMVRFELELALLRGDLEAGGIPDAWNRLYQDYLGLDVPDDARGCLQDVHWSCGMFGYFPTYTLGNLHSAQLFAKAQSDCGDLDAQFAAGEFGALKSWLNEHVHSGGRTWRAGELCEQVTGKPLSADPLLEYLEAKLQRVYRM